MADFMRSLVERQRMQQAYAYQQAQMRQRAMAQQALEQERMRQEAARQQMNQRILQQNAENNALGWARFRATQEDNAKREQMAQERGARQELALQRGPLKPGYRWESPTSTRQVLVENGPEWTRLRAQHAGDLSKLQSVNNSTQEFARTIDYILDPKNRSGFNSNFGGWNAYVTRLLPNVIPGFAHTSDVSTAIDRLNELAETSGLGNIRGNAGQSVGSITEKEWPKFAAQLLKISPRMDEDTARMSLKEARATALGIRNREMGAYKNEWEPTPFYNKNPLQTPPDQPAPQPQPQAQPSQEPGQWQVIR